MTRLGSTDRRGRRVLHWAITMLAAVAAVATPGLTQEEETAPAGAGADAAWRAEARWDTVDEISTAEIHRHTTDPEYLTPLVSYIPDHPEVPSPRDVLGYIAGTEGKLTHPNDEIRYFETLAESSPRVQLREMGLTEEGRRMLLVVVSSAENLARLDELKAHTAALADPRRTDEAAAKSIIEKAKPIMHITAGLHSPETGPPEMVMELAYRVAVSEHPDIQEIRDNVVLLITPVTEPDGRARVVEWYYRHLEGYDHRLVTPSRSPPYWGSHAYHDNNRDGLQMTLKLTQNYVRAFHEWHPTYSLDLHESVPLLYVSTGTGPYNRTLDPITVAEWQWIANWEITELTRQGLPGVWTWGFYTGWNPSYLLWVTNNHNSLGRFYETFGNSSPMTMERDLEGSRYSGKDVTSRQWYRSQPPKKKFVWSLRNNTNYMQSGVLASLRLTARNGDTLLENAWRKGRNSLQRGIDETPHAWVIPADQPARDRLAYLINQLRRHAIEVHRATADFEVEEGTFSAGDFVVRLDQPYGDFARNLLQITKFPEDAEQRPYDDVSWTFGKIYRVDTQPIDDPSILEMADLEPVDAEVAFPGKIFGSGGAAWVIAQDGSNTFVTLRYLLDRFAVLATEEAFEDSDRTFPPGSFVLRPQPGLEEALAPALEATRLDAHGLGDMPEVPMHDVDLPRIALYHNWVSTQPDGWVRYTLGEAGIPYDYINDDDLRSGDLPYDVIVMAHQGGGTSFKALVHGRDDRLGPQPYEHEEGFESHGVIDSSADITGGMGFEGLANLETFLDDGGTLILLGSAGVLATDSGLLRNVSRLSAGEVNTPGSAIQTQVRRRDHPLVYGYDDVHHVFRTNGPVYSVPRHLEHWIVSQYGTKPPPQDDDSGSDDNPQDDSVRDDDSAKDEVTDDADDSEGDFLLIGYVSGRDELERKGVVLDVPRHGGGRVLLYSFNPLHRYLNHGDHNYLFNALLHWNDFPAPEPKEHPDLAED